MLKRQAESFVKQYGLKNICVCVRHMISVSPEHFSRNVVAVAYLFIYFTIRCTEQQHHLTMFLEFRQPELLHY